MPEYREIKSYEAHITIEPVFGDAFKKFETLCRVFGFKPAELLLQKAHSATAVRSNKDSFCTGHSLEYNDIKRRAEELVKQLKAYGFAVWRYKIEGIVLDVRYDRLIQIGQRDGDSIKDTRRLTATYSGRS